MTFSRTVFSPFKAHYFFQANPGNFNIKFNFVSLFVKAWLQAVTPATVISGFMTCGIYSLISCVLHVISSKTQSRAQDLILVMITLLVVHTRTNGDASMNDHNNKFTAEQEELFMRQFDAEYNLFIDPDYPGKTTRQWFSS